MADCNSEPVFNRIHGLGPAQDFSIRRLRLDLKDLARQLGVPDSLIREYQRRKFVHEMTRGEISADLGFMSEELAAFAVLAHCHATLNVPLSGKGSVMMNAVQKLCTARPRESVFLVLRDSPGGYQGALVVGDKVQVEATEAPLHVFDLTALRGAFETMLGEGKVKFPRAQACRLKADDPRIVRVSDSNPARPTPEA